MPNNLLTLRQSITTVSTDTEGACMRLPYDCFRCNGESKLIQDGDVVHIDTAPLCTRCLRYLNRDDYGPRTPFMQGRFMVWTCLDYLGMDK